MRHPRGVAVAVSIASVATFGSARGEAPDAVCAVRAPIAGQDDWCEHWVGESSLWARMLHASRDGGELYAVGEALDTGAPRVAVIDAASGSTMRSFPVDPAVPGATRFLTTASLFREASGELLVTGLLSGRTEDEYGFHNYDVGWVGAYATMGALLWQRTLGPLDGSAFHVPQRIDAVGDAIFLGSVTGTLDDHYFTTTVLDAATGAPAWAESFDDAEQWIGGSIAVAPDGETVYAMTLVGEGVTQVLAYRTETPLPAGMSRLKWRYQGFDPAFRYGRGGMDVTADGSRVVLSGYDITDPMTSIAVLALDESGEVAWLTPVPTSGKQVQIEVDLDEPDARVDLADVRTQSVPWLFDVGDSHAVASGITLEWDPQYGTLSSAPAISVATGAVDLVTGELSWVATYRGAADRAFVPTSLVAEGDRAIVTGLASDCNFMFRPPYPCTTEIGFVTTSVEYGVPSGSLRRVARYNHTDYVPFAAQPGLAVGPGYDGSTATALAADGTYYVTGFTTSEVCDEWCPPRLVALAYAP